MAKYKTMRDIPYLKFMEFSNEIKDLDSVQVLYKTMEYFYPNVKKYDHVLVEQFEKATRTEGKKQFLPYLIRLGKLDVTEHFIDGVNYADAKRYRELFKIILRPWYWFGSVDVEKINLSDGQRIMQSFTKGSMR